MKHISSNIKEKWWLCLCNFYKYKPSSWQCNANLHFHFCPRPIEKSKHNHTICKQSLLTNTLKTQPFIDIDIYILKKNKLKYAHTHTHTPPNVFIQDTVLGSVTTALHSTMKISLLHVWRKGTACKIHYCMTSISF